MDDFHCSFCGKRRREVPKLISGPQVFICNHCVAGFRRSFDAQFPPPPPPAHPHPSPPGRRLSTDEYIRHWTASSKDGGVAFARAYGVELSDLRNVEVAAEVLALLPAAVAWRWCVLPLGRAGAKLKVALSDPSDGMTIAAVMEATGLEVEAMLARPETMRHALLRHYPRKATPAPDRDCSFCGKPASDCTMTLSSPEGPDGGRTVMCDACLELCEDIIAEEPGAW